MRTPPPAMPASATATRFAAHWIADALAGDESLDFSALQAFVFASPEFVARAPEATRERVALRSLEAVSALVAAGGDAASTAKVPRVDDARSCEDSLLQLIGEVVFRDSGREISATSEENDKLFQLKKALEKYKEEVQANKNYMVQLESALKSAKEAQDLLRSQADSTRTLMLKDEEFKSPQLKVREIDLLRESNIQLREENRHNFEECQKFRDEAQKAKMESERLQSLLLEKEVGAEIRKKELEMQKAEIANLNQRISELVENSKGIDLNTYESMENELQNIKVVGVRTRSQTVARAAIKGVAKVAPPKRKKVALTPLNVMARDHDADGHGEGCYMKLRSSKLFMTPPHQPLAPRAPGPAKAAGADQVATLAAELSRCSSTVLSVDVVGCQERSLAYRSDAAEAGEDHILEVSPCTSGNGLDRKRLDLAAQKKAQAKCFTSKAKIWDGHAETLFCTCYLDLLNGDQDFKRLGVQDKFKIIAKRMSNKLTRQYTHQQLNSKYKRLKSLYNVYITPEVERNDQWWKKKKREDADFKIIRKGQSLPIFDLFRKIMEAEGLGTKIMLPEKQATIEVSNATMEDSDLMKLFWEIAERAPPRDRTDYLSLEWEPIQLDDEDCEIDIEKIEQARFLYRL